MGKLLLSLTLAELVSLMKKLPYFDNLIDLDGILEGLLHISVHDPIKFHWFDAVKVEFCRVQLLIRI
jgi:hypothetical protein